MKLKTALLGATVLAAPLVALPGMAQAQTPVTGIYVGAGVGYNILMNEKVTAGNSFGSVDGHVKFRGGFVGLGSVGYGFGNGLRAEIEGDYYTNQSHGTTGVVNTHGWENKYGAMVNLLYDFNMGWPIVPYVGAGVGVQWANWQNGTASLPGGPSVGVDGTKVSFAYQAILGAALPIDEMPGLAVTAEYRFMGLAGHRNYAASVGDTGIGTVQSKTDFNNSFLIGVRYNFGAAPAPAPAPAPVAAPAPAPARTYLVFFDWDKATLTDRAKQIVAEAAENSTKVKYTRIQVNGYTDTSGTPHYNMGLSVRRANAVKAQLIADGVPSNVIGIEGFGETHLLVPTGPGVREPQNRRVEIIIQ